MDNGTLESLNRIYTNLAVEAAERLVEDLNRFLADPQRTEVNPYTLGSYMTDFVRRVEVAMAARLHRN
jgi:hypothetical protein